MAWYSRSAWQVVAVAAFAATASLAIVVTRPPPPVFLTGAASTCRAAGLYAWLGVAAVPQGAPRVGAASSARADTYYTLEFTNISGQTCSLYGYPNVWAYTGGRQVGRPAVPDRSVRPGTVTLAPGATAHTVLRYSATATFEAAACRQVATQELRVYPPDSHGVVVAQVSIPACSRKGPGFLSVQPVQPRAGIPGFPHY
jgi:hypothetical protein